MTEPEVFIIESLTFDDEKNDLYEGKVLSNILALNKKKKTKYYYIRTKRELAKIVDKYDESNYRYLHLSCHGNSQSMATTLDKTISFQELGKMFQTHLAGRRLFVSSCEMVNTKLANAIMPASDCISIIGPAEEVGVSDAAILWASFYHLMFNNNSEAMKPEEILKYCQLVANLYTVPLNYFYRYKKGGFGQKTIAPS